MKINIFQYKVASNENDYSADDNQYKNENVDSEEKEENNSQSDDETTTVTSESTDEPCLDNEDKNNEKNENDHQEHDDENQKTGIWIFFWCCWYNNFILTNKSI